jgi:hypothetical protein
MSVPVLLGLCNVSNNPAALPSLVAFLPLILHFHIADFHVLESTSTLQNLAFYVYYVKLGIDLARYFSFAKFWTWGTW